MNDIYRMIEAHQCDKLALVDEKYAISYLELIMFCKQVRNRISDLNKGDRVVIFSKKSARAVIMMISMMYCGVVYLPLDEHTPVERIKKIMDQINAKYLFTDRTLGIEKELLIDECLNMKEEARSITAEEPRVQGNDQAYMICTSGSTGEPKMVMVEQHNLLNLIDSLHDRVYRDIEERRQLHIAVVAPFSFDASVKQIYCALCFGHTLYICGDKEKILGRKFLSFIQTNKIDVLDSTPSLISSVYADLKRINADCVKTVILGGEKLHPKQIRECREMFGSRIIIVNVYGPTECCVDTTLYRIPPNKVYSEQDEIPIGTPLNNIQLELSDDNELIIKGDCVAAGYYGTENQGGFFVDENGIRSYRSGDICYVEDGLFYHVGRKDEQVKINGFRIEPSIVDFELSQLAGVSFSVTIDIPFNDRKILCTVIRSNLQEKEVLLYLKKHVPDYCLPKLFVRIDTETKLNVNGKIDKAFYRNYCVDHIKSR